MPARAGVARLATRDIAVDGYRVQAGSLVAVGIYALHHDPTLWPDPMDFDPERFSPENSKGRDRWQFLPFLAAEGGRASANTSRGWKPRWRWRPSSGHMEIRSVDEDFPFEVPFTTVAKGPSRHSLGSRGNSGAGEQHRLFEGQPPEDRTQQDRHRRRGLGLRHHPRIGISKVLP